jgi:hypothetical protein
MKHKASCNVSLGFRKGEICNCHPALSTADFKEKLKEKLKQPRPKNPLVRTPKDRDALSELEKAVEYAIQFGPEHIHPTIRKRLKKALSYRK